MERPVISKAVLPLFVATAVGVGRLCAGATSDEPPSRTSLADAKLRFTVPDKPYVVLRRDPLEAVVVDNRAVDDNLLPGHRAGYHGLASLKHAKQERNLFVPSYAGLNFEHIHDGTLQDNKILFEPRNAPMQLRVIDGSTAELYQPPTPHWGLESCLRYQLVMRTLYRPVTNAANEIATREELRESIRQLTPR